MSMFRRAWFLPSPRHRRVLRRFTQPSGPLAAGLAVTLALVGCGGSTGPSSSNSLAPSAGQLAQASASATATAGTSPSAAGRSTAASPSAALSFLPSHGRLAFSLSTKTNGVETHDVVTIEPDGSRFHNLTADSDPGAGAPAWTPDGKNLVYGQDIGTTAGHLFIAEPDGSNPRELTSGPFFDDQPIVSPDGATVAFVRHPATGPGSIMIMPLAADGSPRLVVKAPSAKDDLEGLAISPDGRHLAYVLNGGLFSILTDGSGRRRLTPDAADAVHPGWSPAGTQILFGNPDGTAIRGGRQVWSADPTGTGAVAVTHETGGSFAYDPTWSPDGP